MLILYINHGFLLIFLCKHVLPIYLHDSGLSVSVTLVNITPRDHFAKILTSKKTKN